MQKPVLACLLFLSVAVPTTASAQVGVYDDRPQSIREARENRQGITITGNVRHRIIPRQYTVRRGDTLWDVTGRFYSNPWEWPRVWSYNPEITNPHWIYPLDQLRLLPPGALVIENQGGRTVAPVRALQTGTVFLRQEGYLDQDALDDAGVVVGSPEDHMLLSPYDQVYLEFNEDVSQEPTGEYTVFRELTGDERNQDEEGRLVRIYGAVRIESYDRERRTARATIIEALDPIERGFRVAPIPRRFDLVPPRPADRDVRTTVVATLRPRELLGSQQIIFIPVGREEGVAVGNRFFVVRAGDEWRAELPASARESGSLAEAPDELDAYPSEILAEGIVVHVRPSSSTLMITRSVQEIEVGDRAEMRQGY